MDDEHNTHDNTKSEITTFLVGKKSRFLCEGQIVSWKDLRVGDVFSMIRRSADEETGEEDEHVGRELKLVDKFREPIEETKTATDDQGKVVYKTEVKGWRTKGKAQVVRKGFRRVRYVGRNRGVHKLPTPRDGVHSHPKIRTGELFEVVAICDNEEFMVLQRNGLLRWVSADKFVSEYASCAAV